MNDSDLETIGQEYKAIADRIKKLEKLKAQRKDAILAELKRRKIKTYDSDGIRLTYVQGEYVQYSEDKLVEAVGRRTFRALCDYSPSSSKIAAAIKKGKIDMEAVEAASTVHDKAPYPNVTVKDNS